MRNRDIEYSAVVELAEFVRIEAANLSEMASFHEASGFGEWGNFTPEAEDFVSRVGEEKMEELRKAFRDLSDFLWHYCSPRGVLRLGHRPGSIPFGRNKNGARDSEGFHPGYS